jgi:hypothetical protein
MSRDDYHRCKYCKKLFKEEDCTREVDNEGQSTGYQCPNGCQPTFEQPPYEPPTNNETLPNN